MRHSIRLEHGTGRKIRDHEIDRTVFIAKNFINDFYLTNNSEVNEGEFSITPNMPYCLGVSPIKAHQIGEHYCLLYQNPPSVAEAAGGATLGNLIQYLFALIVYKEPDRKSPRRIITLEKLGGQLDDIMIEVLREELSDEFDEEMTVKISLKLCYFDQSGRHHIVDTGNHLSSESGFISGAEKIIQGMSEHTGEDGMDCPACGKPAKDITTRG